MTPIQETLFGLTLCVLFVAAGVIAVWAVLNWRRRKKITQHWAIKPRARYTKRYASALGVYCGHCGSTDVYCHGIGKDLGVVCTPWTCRVCGYQSTTQDGQIWKHPMDWKIGDAKRHRHKESDLVPDKGETHGQ